MSALENAKNMSREAILEKVSAAGLREFGADVTPVAEKWKCVNEERALQAAPICVAAGLSNSDYSGVLLNLLKKDPKRVCEGMGIAALAVDVREQYLYLPESEAAYANELSGLTAEYGIEVKTGLVDVRAHRGSALHHFETMLALADLFEDVYEPAVYLAVCRGEKTGELRKVPYGTTVAEVIAKSGEEISPDEIKAVAVGTKLYDAGGLNQVIEADTPIGSGVITVFEKNCCMIHEAEKILYAERAHSCGKCTFCREGLVQLHTMTKEITQGQGKKEFTAMLSEIGEAMTFSTPCSMGQTAADITLGTLAYFSDEYEDHIRKKKCAVNVCSAFMSIYIDPNLCEGCEECADVCPAEAIEGKAGYIHMIDEFECTKCGKCIPVCEEEAIIQTTGRVPKLPTRLTKVGKFKKRH